MKLLYMIDLFHITYNHLAIMPFDMTVG